MTNLSYDFTDRATLDFQSRLIDRASRGDVAAFMLIVAQYKGRIFRFVSSLVGNSLTAEVILIDAFAITFRLMNEGQTCCGVRDQLYRTCLVQARRLELDRQPRDAAFTLADIGIFKSCARADGPRRDRESSDLFPRTLYTEMVEIMRTLPFDVRAALLLRELEQLPYEQMAIILQCPVPVVKQRIFIAREALSSLVFST